MDSSATDMALAELNGYVQAAKFRRYARQWRPVEHVIQNSKDVGLVARARSRSSLCRFSCVSLVSLLSDLI
jgi:hypothetical protein